MASSIKCFGGIVNLLSTYSFSLLSTLILEKQKPHGFHHGASFVPVPSRQLRPRQSPVAVVFTTFTVFVVFVVLLLNIVNYSLNQSFRAVCRKTYPASTDFSKIECETCCYTKDQNSPFGTHLPASYSGSLCLVGASACAFFPSAKDVRPRVSRTTIPPRSDFGVIVGLIPVRYAQHRDDASLFKDGYS